MRRATLAGLGIRAATRDRAGRLRARAPRGANRLTQDSLHDSAAASERRRAASVRQRLARRLERFGLEGPAYRLVERARVLKAIPELVRPSRRTAPDGIPLPPPKLRLQVTHTPEGADFLAQGERAARTIVSVLDRTGRNLESFSSVLDFGCGCGRVMRQWASVSGPCFVGSDYNSALVGWCQQNLTFAEFKRNELVPPLPFREGEFDFVYALSVFTHLSEPLQHGWMDELARVIKPGGLLLFTTRGDAWTYKLSHEEKARFNAGELVVRYGGVEGTNLCAVWHPWSYVDERLAGRFRRVESLPAGLEDGAQDVHVFERVASRNRHARSSESDQGRQPGRSPDERDP
jgi:SAM-dependent methyltransferase